MDATKIFPQGEEGKFLIDIEHEGFDPSVDDFQVKLSWGMTGQSITIHKSEMIEGDEGTFLFVFDSYQMIGQVVAECQYFVPDDNYPDGYRTEVDRQILCVVTPVAAPKYVCCPVDKGEHDVTYIRVQTSSVVITYSQLVTKDDEPLITSDEEMIYVRGSMPRYTLTYTGLEVQQLLEKIDNM